MVASTVTTPPNPYGAVDETGVFKPKSTYQKVASPYTGFANPYDTITSPYGQDYQTGLADIIRAQTQKNLTGIGAQNAAQDRRAAMAPAGVLSGTAFDRAQERVTTNALAQEQNDIAQQTAEARNQDLAFNANTALQKGLFNSDLAFKNAAFGADQGQNENTFNRDLWQKAIGYDTEQTALKRQQDMDQLDMLKSRATSSNASQADVDAYNAKASQIYGAYTPGNTNTGATASGWNPYTLETATGSESGAQRGFKSSQAEINFQNLRNEIGPDIWQKAEQTGQTRKDFVNSLKDTGAWDEATMGSLKISNGDPDVEQIKQILANKYKSSPVAITPKAPTATLDPYKYGPFAGGR